MLLRRKIQGTLAGFAFGTLLVGLVAGLALWYVRAGLPPEGASEQALRLLTRSLWLVGTVTVLVVGTAAVASGWLVRSFQASLGTLEDAVEQVQAGRLDAEVPVNRDDELGRLARSINRMTSTLSRTTVSRSYLHAVLDSMAEMLFVVNADGRIEHANRAALDTLNRPLSALKGTPLADVFDTDPLASTSPEPAPDAAPSDAAPSDAAPSDVVPVERTLTPADGPERPVLVSRSRLRGTDATLGDAHVVCVAQDISARKEVEAQLRQSLEEKDVLLREIHHRVKNNLQVISSLLYVQAKTLEDPEVQQRFVDSQERIRSMAAIHEQLYESDNLAEVDFAAYLDALLTRLFRSHQVNGVVRALDADPVPLAIDQAIPAGLIVNELVSNALEHAFRDEDGGTLAVRFHVTDGTGTLCVEDDGAGASLDAMETGSSLGLRLVRGLVRQLNGDLALDTDGGVSATVTFPLVPPSPLQSNASA
jgi:two-component sensor histidine kinase/HAMP domain-containing protein